MQSVIEDYGSWFITQLRRNVLDAKQCYQQLHKVADLRPLSDLELQHLCEAKSILLVDDRRKLQKWQIRARQLAFMDKGCSSKKFFKSLHQSRQNESIHRVKLASGLWTTSKSHLAQSMSVFYKALFEAPLPPDCQVLHARQQLLHFVIPIVSQQEASRMERPFTSQELDQSLKDLGQWKSSGWDGLTVEFFMAFWDIMSDPLLCIMNHAWET